MLNAKYKKYHQHWFQNHIWLNDSTGLLVQAQLERRFRKRWHDELERIHKVHFPRRKKIKIEKLPPAIIQATQEKWIKTSFRWLEQMRKLDKALTEWLNNNAVAVVLEQTTTMQVVGVSSVYNYNSQGSARDKYAQMALESDRQLLLTKGFTAEIVANDESGVYYLRANCESYILDALTRLPDSETILQWAIACWRRGVNPKVYYPYLSPEIYNQSLEQWDGAI